MEAADPSLSVRLTNKIRLIDGIPIFNANLLSVRSERLEIANGVEVMGRRHRSCEIPILAEGCARVRHPRRQSWSGKAMFLNALENDDVAKSIISVRPKTGDLAVARRRRRVFSWRILRPVGIFSKKSSPSRAEKAASRDVGGLRATPKRPTSRVGYQNRNRPRLRGHQTSSTASTRFASQTLSFLTLQ